MQNLLSVLADKLLFVLGIVGVTFPDQNLLKNGHDIWIIKSLSSKSVDDSRNVHFSSAEQNVILMLDFLLSFSLLKELNVGSVAHFCKDLDLFAAFLNSFIDENALSI